MGAPRIPETVDDLPGVQLPALPEPLTGVPGPAGASALKSLMGTRVNPRAIEGWYQQRGETLTKADAPVTTEYHPRLARQIQALEGLDPVWGFRQAPIDQWPFSRLIARVVPSPDFPQFPLPVGTYWIDYYKITESTLTLPTVTWAAELKARLPEGSQLILGPVGPYESRGAEWKLRYELFDSAFLDQFDAVVTPDFSSYLNDPTPHALIAERMTQVWAQSGAERGRTIIPTLSWQSEEALMRQVDRLGALAEAGYINTVYVELLSTGVGRDWWIDEYRAPQILAHLAHLPIRWLFTGVDAGWVVRRMREVLPNGNFHIVSLWPWMRTALEPGLSGQKAKAFRVSCQQLEEWSRGEHLPPARAREITD